jgi:16S rRNA (guanine(527)-N(7))-methyltransferase RsmG
MARGLPALSREQFGRGVAALSPELLADRAMDSLFVHYQELCRWNDHAGLIGRGTFDEILARHYGESLAALTLIPQGPGHGLDLGSGGGFPGLVVAAARPELEMTLLEPREKKWSFLATAARKAGLSCRCLSARVASPLPAGLPESIDLVTVRALRLERDVLGALAERLRPEGSILLWVGAQEPDLPPALRRQTSVSLPGSERRRILRLQPA